MPLPIDYKIDKIFKIIQKELKDELDIDISLETIERVINQQIVSTINGMANGDSVIWKYFGKFVATQKRVDSLNKVYERKGKIPTLVDYGYKRLSFTRQGSTINEGIFEPTSVKDLIPKFILDEQKRETNSEAT